MKARTTLCFLILMLGLTAKSQWKFLESPHIGTPVCMDAQGDTIYVCTMAGLFYSDNQAMWWKSIPVPDSAIFINEITAENGHLYMTASEEDYGYNPTLLFRSDDMGKNWKSIGLPQYYYYTLLAREDTLIIGYPYNFISVSTDAGESFIQRQARSKGRLFYHGNVLMAIEDSVLFHSDDLGISWDSIVLTFGDFHLAEIYSNDSLLWRTDISNDYRDTRISKSINNGVTWHIVFEHHYFAETGHFIVQGQNDTLLVADRYGRHDLYFSSDGGNSWLEKDIPSGSCEPFYVDGLLFFQAYNGILVTRDFGDSFQLSNKGFTSAKVDLLAWYGDKIWINANGSTWIKESPEPDWIPVQNIQHIVSTLDGHLVGRVDGVRKRSSDGGMTWTNIETEDYDPPLNILTKFIAAGNMLYSVFPDYFGYVSSDRGVSWKISDYELNKVEYNQKYIASTSDGYILISDDGIIWEDITYNLPVSSVEPNVKMLHYHNGYVFTSLYGLGRFRLTPGSTTWAPLTQPIPPNPLTSFNVQINTMQSIGNLLLAGVHGYGVYASNDNGDTWFEVNSGLEDRQVLTSAIIEDEVYLGVNGGVWKRPVSELSTTAIKDVSEDLLLSVSPIPTTDFLNIRLSDNVSGAEIQCSLFDSKGVLIQYNAMEYQPENKFDIRGIPTGIYFLTVTTGNKSGIAKVVKH